MGILPTRWKQRPDLVWNWLSLWIFALDSLHWEPIGAVCGRHYLVAGVFGLISLGTWLSQVFEYAPAAMIKLVVGHWPIGSPTMSVILVAAVLLIAIVIAVRRLRRILPPTEVRVMWCFALGALLAYLPGAMMMEMTARALFFATIGSSVLLAFILRHVWLAWRVQTATSFRFVWGAPIAILVLVRFVFSPAVLVYSFYYFEGIGRADAAPFVTAEAAACPERRAQVSDVLVMNAGPILLASNMLIRHLSTAKWWQLSPSRGRQTLTRTGNRHLHVKKLRHAPRSRTTQP